MGFRLQGPTTSKWLSGKRVDSSLLKVQLIRQRMEHPAPGAQVCHRAMALCVGGDSVICVVLVFTVRYRARARYMSPFIVDQHRNISDLLLGGSTRARTIAAS